MSDSNYTWCASSSSRDFIHWLRAVALGCLKNPLLCVVFTFTVHLLHSLSLLENRNRCLYIFFLKSVEETVAMVGGWRENVVCTIVRIHYFMSQSSAHISRSLIFHKEACENMHHWKGQTWNEFWHGEIPSNPSWGGLIEPFLIG